MADAHRVCVVLAGGDPVDAGVRALLPDDAYVVAADSGLYQAGVLGLDVDLLIGDLDSVDATAVDAAAAAGTVVERHPPDKDATDLELALAHVHEQGAERVTVVGGAGGRLDHFVANVLLLASPALAPMRIDARIGDARVAIVRGGEGPVDLEGRAGSLVTLLPVGGPALGVVTDGLQYPLRREALGPGTSRGVSNVLVGRRGEVALDDGTLLVVQPFGGDR